MTDPATPEIRIMRSPLSRARGLGAAKSGLHHWWGQRASALALIPLSIWFVIVLLGSLGASRAAMIAWTGMPLNTVLLLCLIVATFYHMQLGLVVVVEDYVHAEGRRFATLMLVKAVSILLALACVVSVLKLAFLGTA